MNNQRICKTLTIFEGPDGSGKTTAAREFAERHGARYVHFGSLPRVSDGLARMYVEAMLPALLGYQDVVFDRSWLSEYPYGYAFRDGSDRLGKASKRMLERIALRCGAFVVFCMPRWKTVKRNFTARKHQDPASEMLDDVEQLRHVYDLYGTQGTGLNELVYDYENPAQEVALKSMPLDADNFRPPCHFINNGLGGNLRGQILIVGEELSERKNQDSWFQAPFVSFSQEGCSQWLTNQVARSGISESHLLWANVEDLTSELAERFSGKMITLGMRAGEKAEMYNAEHESLSHPQAWKRFKHREDYPIASVLRGLL